MIIVILFSFFTVMVSAVPSQGGATQAERVQPDAATNQKAETPAPFTPNVEQPQLAAPQLLTPQGGPQIVPSVHQYTWSPIGGGPVIIPLQPNIYGFLPANQPAVPQQPLIATPYGYVPVFSSPHSNQPFSPFGYPAIPNTSLPPTPANQPPYSPVSPAGTPPGVAPSGEAPQTVQQQQNPQIIYMVQQRMSPPPGTLSSEELENAGKVGQLGVYMPTVLTNLPTGAVQPVSQATRLTNPEQQGIVPNGGMLSAGVPQTQGLTNCQPQPHANSVPAGLEQAAQDVATVQTHAQPKLQPTHG